MVHILHTGDIVRQVLLFHKGIVAQNLHIKAAVCLFRQGSSNISQSNDTQGLSPDVVALKRQRRVEIRLAGRLLQGQHVLGHGQDRPQGVLSHGIHIGEGRAHHVKAKSGGSGHIHHVVHAHAVLGHHLKLLPLLQNVLGEEKCLGKAGVAVFDQLLHDLRILPRGQNHLAAVLLKQLLAGLRHVLRQQYLVSHFELPPLFLSAALMNRPDMLSSLPRSAADWRRCPP